MGARLRSGLRVQGHVCGQVLGFRVSWGVHSVHDRVVECLPETFNAVDPRVVGRLEDQHELRVVGQEGACLSALGDDVVVEDQRQPTKASVPPS